MSASVYIHWFRQDLRLNDNPAFLQASELGCVLPIYIFDDINAGEYAMGSASRVWLHHSLTSLSESLGGMLSCYRGDASAIFEELISRFDVRGVCWNRCYEPWRIARDTGIKKMLGEKDIPVYSYNGSLLWEPWDIVKSDSSPYRVFTPYYNKGCLQYEPPRMPVTKTDKAHFEKDNASKTIDELSLLPTIRWDKKMVLHWKMGELGAQNRLKTFLHEGLNSYIGGRDMPGKCSVSRLSPHLHFGEISPHQIWHAAQAVSTGTVEKLHIEGFCRELGWREFSYNQLYFNPELPKKNIRPMFDDFPWESNDAQIEAWQRGETGIPLIDAGMRELWQTGYMHNRVRMVVGSFLVKNLRMHWHHGERWFWDCLFDADLANNSAGWQWVTGSGIDAAPYFRIFNPVLQSKKFDPNADYILKYLPVLTRLPVEHIHAPYEAPQDVLRNAGIVLGEDYPHPIVDLATSRKRALEIYSSLSS